MSHLKGSSQGDRKGVMWTCAEVDDVPLRLMIVGE